jgi:hypothetical protein
MRKVISFCLLYGMAMMAHAETCPPVNQILVQRSGSIVVVAPAGWRVVTNDKRPAQTDLAFVVAAWGDHKHPVDNVRCHYYHNNVEDHVQLETQEFIDESRMKSHPEWSQDDPLYHLCVNRSDNVNGCPFG